MAISDIGWKPEHLKNQLKLKLSSLSPTSFKGTQQNHILHLSLSD
jgi:hypothetical protein